MKRLILTAGLAAFAFAPVAASDLPPLPESNQPSWTGLSLGAGIGGGAVVHDLGLGFDDDPVTGSGNFDGIGGEGWIGGLHVAADYQSSSFVIGVFADYDWSNISTDLDFSMIDGADTMGVTGEVPLDSVYTIGGRLGYLVNPRTLVYALAGYSHAEMGNATISLSENGTEVESASLDLPSFNGYTLGAGAETQLAGNFFLKGEYRYTGYKKETLFGDDEFAVTMQPSTHTARMMLVYKFSSQ